MEAATPTVNMTERPGMVPVLTEVCRLLGGGWHVLPEREDVDHRMDRHHVDLGGPDGMVIHVNGLPWQETGKWSISGRYPSIPGKNDSHDWARAVVGYNGDTPGIKFSHAKPAAQIARDIHRRFLGEYTRIYRAAVEKRDAHVKLVAERVFLADRLAKRFGLRVSGTEGERCHWSGSEDRPGYGDLNINYGGTVNLELKSLPPEVAEAVLAVLFPGK